MRTMRFLFCAACLCSAGVFARAAMTQETTLTPVDPDGLPRIQDATEKPLTPLLEQPTTYERRGDDRRFDNGRDNDGSIDGSTPMKPVLGGTVRQQNPFERRSDGSDAFYGGAPRLESPLRPRRVTRTVVEMHMEPIPPEEFEASQKLQAAVQSLRTGTDEAARKAATDVIQQQLTTQFENDLKQREKELAEVEQRVKTLREQLDKRKAAKADIINLRLQTLVNEANGLGFPEEGFSTNYLFGPSESVLPPAEPYRSETDKIRPQPDPVAHESRPLFEDVKSP